MAARSYFGKSAKDLTLAEGAMLAGLLKGPNYYNPDRHPDRAKDRLAYVLGRMQEDGVITAAQKDQALAAPPKLVAFTHPHRDSGFNFVDFLGREAKTDGVDSLTAEPYTVHSTINAQLQRDTEAALQEGLAHYEMSTGRVQFRGPEANIADAVAKYRSRQPDRHAGVAAGAAGGAPAALRRALDAGRGLQKGGKKGDGTIRVGLPDGRIVPLTGWSARSGATSASTTSSMSTSSSPNRRSQIRAPNANDAKATDRPSRHRSARQAQLRVRPTVQGAALVLENKTGRILAMAGSFSYPMSQLNRTAQTQRQPGSAMKPLTYLTALQHGLQPNTLVPNEPITLPPIGSGIDGRDVISREYGGTAARGGFLVAAQRRLQRGRRLTRCGAAWKIRSTSSPRICSTAASTPIRRRASTMFAPPPWPRKSTANACAIIRSCSARSRCA